MSQSFKICRTLKLKEVSILNNTNKQKGFIPLVALAVIAALGVGGAGTVAAARGSVPGDVLYPVKEATEALQVVTAFSPEGKAAVHLAIANKTEAELNKLQAKSASADKIQKAAQKIADNDKEAEDETNQAKAAGKDVSNLTSLLQGNLERHEAVLQRVMNQVPDQAKDAIEKAIQNSQKGLTNAIQQQTRTREEEGSGSGKAENDSDPTEHPSGKPSVTPGRAR